MKALSASAHPMTSNCGFQLILSQSNSHDAIGQAQALATDLVTDFELDQGDSSLFIGQSVFQILGTIVTIADVLTPMPKGISNTRPLSNVQPKPPEDVAAIWGLVLGITMSGVSGVWERLQDATVSEQTKVGSLEVILAALQDNVSAIIEQRNDHMCWDAAGAEDLMWVQSTPLFLTTSLICVPRTPLSGGFFLQPTNVSNANADNAWSTDILSRVVNDVWRAYPNYISFTDLADDDSYSKCNDDKVGTQGAEYCADGGVYYFNDYKSSNRKGKRR